MKIELLRLEEESSPEIQVFYRYLYSSGNNEDAYTSGRFNTRLEAAVGFYAELKVRGVDSNCSDGLKLIGLLKFTRGL